MPRRHQRWAGLPRAQSTLCWERATVVQRTANPPVAQPSRTPGSWVSVTRGGSLGKRRSSTSVCLHGSAPSFSGPLRCLPSLQLPQILNSKRTQAAVQRFQWTCHMTLAVPCHPVTSPATASRLKGLPASQRQEPWPSTCLSSPSPGCSPQQRSPEQCLTECQKQRRTGSIREPGTSFPTWLLRTLHRSGDAGLVPPREHCHLAWHRH